MEKLLKEILEKLTNLEKNQKNFEISLSNFEVNQRNFEISQKNFETNQKNFEANLKRIETNQKRIETNQKSFDANLKRIETNQKSFDANLNRLDTNQRNIEISQKAGFESVSTRFELLENKIDKLNKSIETKHIENINADNMLLDEIRSLRESNGYDIQALNKRVFKLESEIERLTNL